MPEVSSIVLYSARPDETIAFYRSVGVGFEDEDHGDGSVHAAVDVGDVHIAVFPGSGAGTAPPRGAGGSTFIGFYVSSLDETLAALRQRGDRVLVDHETQAWGCRAIAEDPDGRRVEINQRGHCPDAEAG